MSHSNKHRTKPLFPRIGQQTCRMWSLSKKEQYELCSPSCDTEKWDHWECCRVGMRKLIGGWNTRGTHLYWQGLRVGLALDISRGFHFVHSWILCAVHTQASLRPGCKLLLGMSKKLWVWWKKLFKFTKLCKWIMNTWRCIPCLPGEDIKFNIFK